MLRLSDSLVSVWRRMIGLGVVLDYGLLGVYVGTVLSYVCWATVVVAGFVLGDWAETASSTRAERAEIEEAAGR